MVDDIAVLGVGMHPWGKWGRNFVDYGVAAIREAIDDAGVSQSDIEFVAGASTMRNGYPGYVAGSTFAQAIGWSGLPVTSAYGACASGAMALDAAAPANPRRALRRRPRRGRRHHAQGVPRPPERRDGATDPDWLRFRLIGATNPTYFGLYARRRMDLHGATEDDFTAVKVKNARHGLTNPGPGTARSSPPPTSLPPQWSPTRSASCTSVPPPTAARR